MTYREMLYQIVRGVDNLDSEVRCIVIKTGPPPNNRKVWIKVVPVTLIGANVHIEANDIEEAKELP
jgi:hypothetical protein